MQSWNEFLSDQEKRLGKETVDKWLRTLTVSHFDACNLYLEASDSFQVIWFEEHIRPYLKTKFLNNNHHQIKVHLTVHSKGHENLEKNDKKEKGEKKGFALTPDTLSPFATFPGFITTKQNEVPLQFLLDLVGFDPVTEAFDSPKILPGSFNPIYLFGPSGSGKTHLLMALADAFQKQGKKTTFVRSETFTDHVIGAIRGGHMQSFREAYRHTDVLLIDDIHLFARRGATQEEFFHTFNTLHTAGKQIILSGHCQPSLLSAIEERLISRFEWGITLPLERLNGRDLLAFIAKRSKALGFPLDTERRKLLIELLGSNPSSLHGALEALVLRSHLDKNSKLTPEGLDKATLESTLSDLIAEQAKNARSPEKIIRAVADYYGIKKEDILGKSQSHEYSLPRQIAMHICRSELKLPYIKIGTLFARDHSTVMSSISQIQKKIDLKNTEICGSLPEILRNLDTAP